jgi:hypothetical protein
MARLSRKRMRAGNGSSGQFFTDSLCRKGQR